MSVTKELVQNVRRRVAEEPGVLTGQLAQELEAREEEVVMALPVAMRKKARARDFAAIWRRMSAWGNVILYTSCPVSVPGASASGSSGPDLSGPALYGADVCGLADEVFAGQDAGSDCMRGPMLCYGALCNREVSARGRAFFEQTGLDVAPRVGSVWFVSMPMFGCRSSSVRLYDNDGEHILSVYLGRDRSGEPDAVTAADFQALWEEFGVTPVPRNCCQGKRCSGACACRNGGAHHHGGHGAHHHSDERVA